MGYPSDQRAIPAWQGQSLRAERDPTVYALTVEMEYCVQIVKLYSSWSRLGCPSPVPSYEVPNATKQECVYHLLLYVTKYCDYRFLEQIKLINTFLSILNAEVIHVGKWTLVAL